MSRKIKKKNTIMLLLLLIVGLGIGYALISTDLTINGVGKFNNQSWDVHFEDLTLNPNNVSLSSGDVAATINQTTMTDITFTVTLQEPGDFYEFEVAAVNSGTMDAMIGLITNNLNGNPIGTGNEVPAYAKYTATYSDGVAIAPNHLLEAGYSETFKVRVDYRTDIDPEDLPGTEQTFTYTFGVQYVQADANAITKPLPAPKSCTEFTSDTWDTIISNAQNGIKYEVGCTKEVELYNSLGTHTIRIANTSTPAECSTTGFSQTACGFVLEFADIITTHRMNSYVNGDTTTIGINSKGGWEYSDMRAYLNSTTYANENIDYSTTGIYSSLPEVLRNAIIDTSVVSGHNSNDTANFTTTDKLYLLSPHEVWEDADTSNSGINDYDTAYNNTRQLDYYANLGINMGTYNSSTSSYDGNYSGAIKQMNNTNSSWWLRSASSNSANHFLYVYAAGGWYYATAYSTIGVSPAFRIA